MSVSKTYELIENFYSYFNSSRFIELFSLMDDRIVQEINYVQTIGKNNVIENITSNKKYYNEKISNLIIMISENGCNASAQFTVNGEYLKTDDTAISASGQKYQLSVLNYFEIENNKIIKGCCFFDDDEWKCQVSNHPI